MEDQEKKEKITFNQWGKEFAQATNCNPEAIDNGLNGVYSDFLKKQKLDKDAIQYKIQKLGEDIETLNKNTEDRKADNKNLEIENKKLNEDIELKKEDIVGLENEILQVTDGKGAEPDKTKLNLYLLFTIIAGIFTFFAYVTSFGSAVIGLKEGDDFINGNVLSDLLDSGTGNLVYACSVVVAPIICGFFYGFFRKKKQLGVATIMIIVIFLIDIFIGYKLTETIYKSEELQGLRDESWEVLKVLEDPNFYIVFVINFALYMAFSFSLNTFFEEQEKLSPNALVEQLKNKIERIKEIIEGLKNKITDNQKKIEINLSEMDKNDISIIKKKEDIESYKAGKLPINTDHLKDLIAQYLEGYQAYANMMIENKENAKAIVNKVLQNAESWFKNKEANGWKNDVEISINKNFFNINND